jgi:radical SAM superfamily enzyme YgiQ (UPF0313 family)
MAHLTLLNLNMLLVRHLDRVERETHVPLGPLYLTHALEDAGFEVDFRDYQLCSADDPFSDSAVVDFLAEPAPVVGLSLMANLLPFALLAARAIKKRYPDRWIVLGGTGPKAVEEAILQRFPWIDVIAEGESERSAPLLLEALCGCGDLSTVPGIFHRDNGAVRRNPRAARIADLDGVAFPAFEHVDLSRYQGYGIMASRGCPYPCTFCSVAPIWDRRSYARSADNVLAEIRLVHEATGADLFLFQDELFVSSKERVLDFCRKLRASGLPVEWKSFGRVDLTDDETMREMAAAGCIEMRYGVESGSARVLEQTRKGFTPAHAVRSVSEALHHFPRVETFFVWGFPFEDMEDFHQSLFQMLSFRSMGVHVLPSLLCFLPQTDVYRDYRSHERFEFCPDLFPEYMVTGHEICRGARVEIRDEHRHIFELVATHPDVFPGFFHFDLEGNVLPKLQLLQEFGFYPGGDETLDSCGAHSPRRDSRQRQMAGGGGSGTGARVTGGW